MAIARSLGTRPSYVLRVLLIQGVDERHQPSHSEWARTHAPGKDPDEETEISTLTGEAPAAPIGAVPLPPERDPVLAYLARLAPSSRRSRQRAVECIARLLSNGRAGAASLDWAALGPEHAAAVRARLAERYARSTVNDHLSALRRVLGECRRLGLVDQTAYVRVASIASLPLAKPSAKGLPRGSRSEQEKPAPIEEQPLVPGPELAPADTPGTVAQSQRGARAVSGPVAEP